MKLIYDKGIWIILCNYEEREIPKENGFIWDKVVPKKWATTDLKKALKLKQYADSYYEVEMERQLAYKKELLSASSAKETDINIPCPKGISYLGFQKAGIKYISERKSFLLADSMGLGKSIETAGLINLIQEIRKVLIICPATLKINWHRELEKWLVRKQSISIINPKTKTFPKADIIIINYDSLQKWSEEIHAIEWDLLIADECDALKSEISQRSKEVFGYLNPKTKKFEQYPIAAKRKGMLSGTPIRNKPIELWPLLNYLDPLTWGNKFSFGFHYCKGQRKRLGKLRFLDFSGSSNEDELQERLRIGWMCRRLKSEVLPELPPKFRQIIELPADDVEGIIKEELQEWQKHQQQIAILEDSVKKAEINNDGESYKDSIKKLKDIEGKLFTEMSLLRKKTAIAKLPYIIEHIKNLLKTEEKITVFGYHHEVLDRLKNEFGDKAVILTGRNNDTEKQEAVDKFMNDPSINIFIGNIIAAGKGITLTVASLALIIELVWVPTELTQAEDRLVRIGQLKNVLIQHLVLEGSLDAYMAKRLIEKQEVIDNILDKPLYQ